MIGRRIGAYDIQALLGEGGMGRVYRARDTRLGRDVAIKIIPPDLAADTERASRLEREARILASLNHPNIAAIYGVEETDGARALVLELVEGPTLAERLAAGPMPVAEALPIARQIAEAMEAAHERGIVHRDLKPANIKLKGAWGPTPTRSSDGGHSPTLAAAGVADCVVKVLDFGLAKAAVVHDATTIAGTEAGVVMGTAPYMSPEQARGAVVDKRSDVWAFGCVLYELLSGARAFAGATWLDTLAAIATREPDYSALGADTPPAVRQLIARCLAKDPQQRLRDIGEARIVLAGVIAGESVRVPAAPPRRLPRAVWIGAASIVAVAALAWIAVRWLPAAPPAEREEYTIPPPEGVVWGELPEDPWPRLSPDGRFVVTAGRSAAGVRSLWIRGTTSVEAHPLPDTTDLPTAAWPFWSPDSRTVAYCTGKQLKKIDLGGRPPETIDVTCATLSGGSWNTSGEILYVGPGGLFKVPARGGPEVRVTTAAPGVGQRYPRWLPDGRRFLFTALTSLAAPATPDKIGVFIGSVDGEAPRRVLPDPSAVEYVEHDGEAYLLFIRVATLLVQRVDPRTLAPIGEAAPLSERIGVGLGKAPPMSATSTLLIYRRGATFGESTLVWIDRAGQRVGLTYSANTAIIDVTLSHDERTIAFSRFNRDTNSIGIWTADVARGTEERLYTPSHYADHPLYSADDRTIAFSENLALSILTPGPAPQPPPVRPGVGSLSDWSADGRTVFGSNGPTVVAIPFAPPTAPPVTLHGGVQPKLSPDGHWLAYTAVDTSPPQVVVERYPELTPRVTISKDGGFQPHWRADGSEIFYMNERGELWAVPIRTTGRFEAGTPARIFRESMQPDGSNFVRADYAVTKDGQRFLVRIASGDPKPLTAVRNWIEGLKK